MKKFLIVLAMVLCMALPAAAETTWTVTNCNSGDATDIKYAVEHAQSGDTIVVAADINLPLSGGSKYGLYISSDQTLTLQISKDCVLSVSHNDTVGAIQNSGNLTITGNGKITSTCTISATAYGIRGEQGSTTIIKGSVEITATAKSETYGVFAKGAGTTVTIKDSAEIAVSTNDGTMCGVCAKNGAAVNILNGTVGGDLNAYDGSTITVYAGTFSNEVTEDYLAPDRVCEKQSEGLWVVTDTSTVKFDPESLDVAPGETGTVKVSLLTKDGNTCSLDKIDVTPTVDGITVTPSSTDGTITVKVAEACAKDTYEFKVACTGKHEDVFHSQTGTLTVTVKGQGDDPTPSGDVKNGGCNAGFAGLALAAFALLAAKRKK